MSRQFEVYVGKKENGKRLPKGRYPTEEVINYLKGEGVSNPVLMQQGTREYLKIGVVGQPDYIFRVYDLYRPSKEFFKNYVVEAMYPFEQINSFEVDFEPNRVTLTVNDEVLSFHESIYTHTSIKDIRDRLRRVL